jgi:hypothetical protein
MADCYWSEEASSHSLIITREWYTRNRDKSSVAEFLDPDKGDKVNSGIRVVVPARQATMAGGTVRQYVGVNFIPQSGIYEFGYRSEAHRFSMVQYWNHATLTQSKFLSALTHSALAEHAFGCQCRKSRNLKDDGTYANIHLEMTQPAVKSFRNFERSTRNRSKTTKLKKI